MAKKRNSGKRQKTKFSKFVSVVLVILAVGYFFYQESPAFKSKVDSIHQAALQKITGGQTVLQTQAQVSQAQLQKPETIKEIPAAEISAGEKKASPAPKKLPADIIKFAAGLEAPSCPAEHNASDHQRRDYTHYSICYRESYEQAEWSAYCLTEDELIKNAGRSDDFRPDPQIKTGSATLADYKGSGYDRGHLSPAADFAFDQNAMSETFYMSNMSPQAGSFNRGIWKDLESEVRSWAKRFGRVYVISGPVLEKPAAEYESIGANKVSIPQYYYKVLLAPLYKDEADKATPEDAKEITAIGFILPNKKCSDSFYNYAVPVDEVERRTGLDFFAGLEDVTEEKVESGFNLEIWK